MNGHATVNLGIKGGAGSIHGRIKGFVLFLHIPYVWINSGGRVILQSPSPSLGSSSPLYRSSTLEPFAPTFLEVRALAIIVVARQRPWDAWFELCIKRNKIKLSVGAMCNK